MSALEQLIQLQAGNFGYALLASAGMFLGLCALQIAFAPRARPRSAAPRTFAVDMIYWPFAVVFRTAAKLCVLGLLVLGTYLLGLRLSPQLYDGFGPVLKQPRWLMLIELFVLTDLLSYLAHRACHRVPLLWRFHAVHHSPRKVYWTSTARFHPVNDLVTYAALALPPLALGFPIEALAPIAPLIALFATWSHSKLELPLGPLQHLITGPRFHRWHHTHSDEGGDANFAGVLAFWDRLFGTYYMPEDKRPERFGLDDRDLPESFWAQMVEPFRSRDTKVPVFLNTVSTSRCSTSSSPEAAAASVSRSRSASSSWAAR